MIHPIKPLLTIIGLFVCQFQILAQAADYSGTWVLNFEKSKLEHRAVGLTGTVFIIKQRADKFKLTRYHIFGEKRRKIGFKMVADGKTRRIKFLFRGKLEQKEDSLVATLWRKNFLNVVAYKFGNSQSELIADEVFKGNPKDHHNLWLFDRKAGK